MILLLLTSIFLYSGLIGVLSAFFVNSDASFTQHKLRVETTKAFLHNHRFSQRLQYRVLNYLDYLWGATKGLNEEQIICGLPETLQLQARPNLPPSILRSSLALRLLQLSVSIILPFPFSALSTKISRSTPHLFPPSPGPSSPSNPPHCSSCRCAPSLTIRY